MPSAPLEKLPRRLAEHGVEEQHLATAGKPRRASEQVAAPPDELEVVGQPRVGEQPLQQVPGDAVVAHQRVAEREQQPRPHAPTASAGRSAIAGSRRVNVVPRPTSLSTSIVPPCRLTMP